MSNMCYNYVHILGRDKNVKSFFAELKGLKNESEELKLGVMPFYVAENKFQDNYTLHLFDIDIHDRGDSFTFNSKNDPAYGTIKAMAFHHKVDVYSHSYEELGNNIYGIYAYNHRTQTEQDLCLSDSDFEKCTCDNKEGVYMYEGETYESRNDIYDKMLEAKRQHYIKCTKEELSLLKSMHI